MKTLFLALGLSLAILSPLPRQSVLVPPSSTTLLYSVSRTDQQVVLASATGLAAGQILFTDKEAMTVSAVNGQVVKVFRAAQGTNVLPHRSGLPVYYGPPANFFTADPGGDCTPDPSLVFIRLPTGAKFGCSTSGAWQSLDTGGGGASTPLTAAAIVTALALDTTQKIGAGNLPTPSGATGCVYQNYWNAATAYPVGSDSCDTVLYGAAPSSMYQSLAGSTNVIPGTDATKWQPVGYIIPIGYTGAYNPASTYTAQQIASYQGSSYIALQTLSAGTTPPSCSAYPGGNSSWGVIACGASVASYSLACTPSSVTVSQGGGAAYTCTVTAQSGFSGTISFTGTGLPSGGTVSFSPSTLTVSSTTPVATTATIATASIATGTYTGIQFSSSSGGQTVLAASTAGLTVTAPGLLNMSSGTFTSPLNLTSVGTDDWCVYAPPDNSNINTMPCTYRKSGGSLIGSLLTMSPGGDRFYNYVSTSNFTWTDASGTSSGNSGNGIQYISASRSYIFTAAADLTVRTMKFYFADSNGPSSTSTNISAVITGTGAPTTSNLVFTIDQTGADGSHFGGYNVVTVNYQAASAGQTLTITVPNAIGSGLEAIALTH